MAHKTTLAVIIGTRDFFPADPVRQGRSTLLALLDKLGVDVVALSETDTHLGAVETWEQSKKCAELFRKNRDRIDGILVALPVFGPEKAVADTIRLSELHVPILVQADPDDPAKLSVALRRDAFCGKISVCNNLYQYGYPFSLTADHTVDPTSSDFEGELTKFIGVCRVVKGLRSARIGAIGARPSIFNTVRFSETMLEASGISIQTVDLSEIFAAAEKLADSDPKVQAKLAAVKGYINTNGIPSAALVRMAKLGIVIDDWMYANECVASALQCWTSIQKNYGVNACTLMSMMSESLLPSGCEVDVNGVVAMYALQLASGRPSALVDWNNNYRDDKNKCVLFHCGNWAKSFLGEATMSNAEILATVLGTDRTYGTVSGLAKPSPLTYARLKTYESDGVISTYVGEGSITGDPLDTFGCRAVAAIPNLQALLQHVSKNGYGHHTAMNPSHVGDIIAEAFETYMGWDVYYHK